MLPSDGLPEDTGGVSQKMPTARYTYRIYPNAEQRQQLARTFGCCRFVYNWALDSREAEYRETGKGLSVYGLQKRLTLLKREPGYEWLSGVAVSPLQRAIADLGRRYDRHFKEGLGLPNYRKKRGRQTCSFGGDKWGLDSGRLRLARVPGRVRVAWGGRPLPTPPCAVRIYRTPDGLHYASFVVKVEPESLPKTGKEVGIDMGITDIVTTSDGWKSGNPRHYEEALAKLRREQRRLSRKKWGSANYEKQRVKVARLHSRVARQRREFLHELSTRLVRENDLVAVENLNIQGMMKNHSLARHIRYAGWGALRQMLRYKCEWYGRTYVEVDRWFASSKTCSACGEKADNLPLKVREWTCPCGATHDRDVNAAENVLQEAKRILAAEGTETPPVPEPRAPNAPGGDVRPATASAGGADACERGTECATSNQLVLAL